MARIRAHWSGLSWPSRVMLVLSVLASAAVAGILAFVLYLFIGGYTGGSNPESVTPILFPVGLVLFLVAGLPSMLVCGLFWAGYSLSRRRRGPARPDGSVWHGGSRD